MKRTLLVVALAAASVHVVALGLHEGKPSQFAFDVYGYFYPHVLYALRCLAAGGKGLLWNPFQNCGQPFFGITETGLLYPLNLFFLVLDPPLAFRAVLCVNLVIGGLGAYGLGRELGVRPVASLGAAFAFVLGTSAYQLTTWMPTVQAPYVWMPVAMLYCERLAKAPSLRPACVLGLALAAGLLPGHPQFVLFTCELVALRLLWGLTDRSERRQLPYAVGGLALAVVLMLLLTACQFLTSVEVIAESVRQTSLRPDEIAPQGIDTWADFTKLMRMHSSLAPFLIIPAFLAPVAVVSAAHRRAALFYLLAGALFLALSFGETTRLGQLYYAIPFSGLFRQPVRFRLITGFCVSVLTGLGIDVLARGSWRALAVAAAMLVGLSVWLRPIAALEWGLAGAVLGGGLLAAATAVARPVATAIIVGAITLAPVLLPHWTTQRFLADDHPFRTHADLFERLRARLTPHDRIQLAMPQQRDPGFQHKTAMLFEMRAITDYENQLSQRYAEYITMLRSGALLRTVNQVYFSNAWTPQTMRWPLVDLAAARYLIINKSAEASLTAVRGRPLTFVDGDDEIRVYENAAALPRAYYVPQVAVVPDAAMRLQRLALGYDDRRRLALLEAAPPSGFLGVPGNEGLAGATFVVDDPEHVVLEVEAPEQGFLFLADQYFPEWSATVNGQPATILPANHTFRLVQVPRGPVRVEFRYETGRVWIGAVISAVTLLVVGGVLITARRDAGPEYRSSLGC